MPIGVAGAVALGGAALSAGATMYASGQQSKAVEKGQASANARQDASSAALGVAGTQANALLQPYQEQGGAAYQQQGDLMGLNGQPAQTAATEQFRTDPGYQFQLQEGLNAIDAGAASKGMLTSGSTIKAEQKFGQGLADQSFQNYYTRLNGLANQGYTANAQGGQNLIGAAGGQAAIANQQAQTDVSAAGTQASIYGGEARGVGNAVNSGLNSYTTSLYSGNGSSMYPQNGGSYNRTNALAPPPGTLASDARYYQPGAPMTGYGT